MEKMATETLQPQGESLTQPAPTGAVHSDRLLSLDGLRGFDMLWIIGGQFMIHGLARVWPDRFWTGLSAQFEHVRWQGFHAFDVIWALFMFMVGVSMTFSLAKRKRMHESHGAIYGHAIKRAVLLFILGMIAQGNLLQFSLSTFHPFYSVLHGIAAGYLIATIVTLNFKAKGQAITTAIFLVGYWILLLTIPVPGVGRGVLTPYGNAATYIDHLVLGRFSYVPLGQENTWFLSYLGFASSVLLGVLAGEVLLSARSKKVKCLMLYGYGAGLLVLGLIWSLWFPIIKLLWTSTFVLVAGGISCLLMATFYLVIDVLGYRKWVFPFTVIGMNALAVYMATELYDFRKIGDIFVGGLLPRVGRWDEVLSAAASLTILWLILYWMYRTRTFVKL
jgi:predicted acyltransferase